MTDTARPLHVIFGTGPLGLALMRALRSEDRRVRMINRSARVRFDKDLETEVGGGDAADPGFAREVCEGAAVVYHCVGLPYPRWREFPGIARGIVEGAAAAGATLVYGDNLYAYGQVTGPLREGLPETASTVKGRIRAEVAALLLDAHRAGNVPVAIGRGSDFFGPHATDATMLGSRVFARILAGRPAQAIGDPDRQHSYTYLDDFGRALVVLGDRPEAAGQIWHVPNAPPLSTRAIVTTIGELAGTAARVSAAPGWMVGLAGLFSPQLRELKEMLYEFDRDFVVDSSRFEGAFGIRATPLRDSLARTLAWFRSTASKAT
ncbi:MAG: NAD-dependent epimerase/dehydratase family protein [Burkholderiales bacterium]|nr:NAD-dependent epimerase/dehydratase family protein [Burkholderiales bacterium]